MKFDGKQTAIHTFFGVLKDRADILKAAIIEEFQQKIHEEEYQEIMATCLELAENEPERLYVTFKAAYLIGKISVTSPLHMMMEAFSAGANTACDA